MLVLALVALILSVLCVLQADLVSFQLGPISIDESSSLLGKAAVLAAETMFLVFLVFAVWMMRRLFANFAQGDVLTSANGRLLRWMGLWCFVAAVAAFTPDGVIFGMFLLVLGWAMELAASVQREQDLTI